MESGKSLVVQWNPWHGCTKISPGCAHCYVYRQDAARGSGIPTCVCRRTAAYGLPVAKGRDGGYKVPPGSLVYTCFSSDFLLADADAWRDGCWRMMRARSDLRFVFFTKRIDRLAAVLPEDWGEGYENVRIGCTVENAERAAYRLPIFLGLPVRHRAVVAEPLLEAVDLAPYLAGGGIEAVTAGGESGPEARPCDYAWVLGIRDACARYGVPFSFHQTGANFIVDGKSYRIARRLQHSQAKKAGIDSAGADAFGAAADGGPLTLLDGMAEDTGL